MFPLDFPLRLLRKSRKGEWVLDPFSGRGTTNFAARVRGLPTVGVDSSPVAAAITAAKLSKAKPQTVIALAREILKTDSDTEVPNGEFWEWAYHRETLKDICKLRLGLLERKGQAANLLRAFLLGRLHGPVTKGLPSYFSNQMPRTYASKPNYAVKFWKDRSLKPLKVDVLEMIRRKIPYYVDDIPDAVEGQAVCGDSRTVDFSNFAEPFSWVITSPPYYGMRTYVPDQWLRNWFLGGSDNVAYEYSNQLQHIRPDIFAQELSSVWRAAAKASAIGAKLRIRFGGIPERNADPNEILRSSLQDLPWKITRIVPAGIPQSGRRQANNFLKDAKKPIEEFDLFAFLYC
jgi:hypothetical protein